MLGVRVAELSALEVLDSRGRPTLQVTVALADGARADAGVPSGASTGRREAVELRDGEGERYDGLGVSTAVGHVNGRLAEALTGRAFEGQEEIDRALIEADGTPNKSRLGANAVVGVSMAVARAVASSTGRPLWQSLARSAAPRLPVPHFNVINGGAHATNALDFQEFMIAPLGAPTMAEAVRAGAEVYAALRRVLADEGLSTGLGDEGGFAPEVSSPEQALRLLMTAVDRAGYPDGSSGVAIALDPAATGFYSDGRYHLAGQSLSTTELLNYYAELLDEFPIWSLEDPLAEDDWAGWRALTERFGARVQLVGDDIFVTDADTIRRAARAGAANASLIKVNQIGTVTETLDALAACREVGFAAMISHRSGETRDDFIADLAVGSGCGQIKSGAPARGERVSKYNRLMAIEAAEPSLSYGLESSWTG